VKAPVLLLLTTLAASVIASGAALTAATRDAVSSPHATMRELALAQLAAIPREERHEQRRSFAPKIAALPGVQAEALVTKPSIAAPPATAGFPSSHDIGALPSDAAGAVSAKYLLSVSNASVMVQDRAGITVSNLTLVSFWHDPAFSDGALYDSRVSYDAAADRWVICTLYDVALKKATVLIAVSDNGDPWAGWHRYRFIVDPNDFEEADLTRMALTRDFIVITANIYNSGTNSDAYVIRKSDAYALPATLPVAQRRTQFIDLVPVDGRDDAVPYFVTPFNDVDLLVYTLNGATFTFLATLTAPVPDITSGLSGASAPQLGSSVKIDCGPIYVTNAVLRNGTIWVASQPFPNTPTRSSVLWWRITLGSPIRVDNGFIDDPTGATFYAFPSIAVNKHGAALIGYSVFSASIYPSAGYSYVDPLNNLSTPALLKSGDSFYRNSRWADFSTTVVDANDVDFWTTQTFPLILSPGQATRWAAWWGKIQAPIPSPARRRAVHH
jgi:hypothetical protein